MEREYEHGHNMVDRLTELLDAGYRLLHLRTFEERRALDVLTALGRRTSLPLYTWSPSGGFIADPVRGELFDALETMQGPAVVVLLDAHLLDARDPLAVRRLKDRLPRLHRNRVALVLVSPLTLNWPELSHDLHRIDLPLPSASQLRTAFEADFPGGDGAFLGRCAELCRGLSLDEAMRAFGLARVRLPQGEQAALTALYEEKRQVFLKARGLEIIDQRPDLSRVGGLSEVKRWLSQRRDAFGLKAEAFGLPAPRGLLMLGVQGCGKSLTAKAIAGQWGFPLVRMDVGGLAGGRTGADDLLSHGLDTCEALAPVVLWVDEIEKGFAGSGGEDASATRVLGAFLSWLQEHKAPVFTVATANNINLLPPELVRRGRFDEIFFVDLPSDEERRDILSVHLHDRGRTPTDFDLDRLTGLTRNFSGAELEQVVVAALYRAFSLDRELADDDLVREADLMVPLYRVQEENVKKLREWAEKRARPASLDHSALRHFKQR